MIVNLEDLSYTADVRCLGVTSLNTASSRDTMTNTRSLCTVDDLYMCVSECGAVVSLVLTKESKS